MTDPTAEQYFNSSNHQENATSQQHISLGLGLSPSRYAEVDAFSNIPWQIKSLYGVISDVYPIRGYHKTPYMVMSSVCGVLSFLLL